MGHRWGLIIQQRSYEVFLFFLEDLVGAFTGLEPAKVCWAMLIENVSLVERPKDLLF